MDLLRLQFEREDEWHGKLTATVSARAFAGLGSARFSTEELRQFAAAASAFPLQEESLPSIRGGFGGSAEAVEQVHLALAFAPHDKRGTILATVQLATEVWNTEEADLASNVTVRFLVTYGDLGRFGPAVIQLLNGEGTEATLQSSVT